jgi:hypothetical protein
VEKAATGLMEKTDCALHKTRWAGRYGEGGRRTAVLGRGGDAVKNGEVARRSTVETREDEWTRCLYGQEDTMLGWCHGSRTECKHFRQTNGLTFFCKPN